jgi:DNA (cytosine-5)-methyltransferase 1
MKIGSLFSGTGGLDMGVQSVLGGEVVWNVEYDDAPSKILEHHWPGVPNYGDVTTIDWAAVAPIDALTAGYPCQPFSQAGKRKGANDARHLWPYVLDAIRHLRPGIVILENVRGHLSLGFGRVLGDLAGAGYDAEWVCLPASAAGAPHLRKRVFILAHPRGEVVELWAGLRSSVTSEIGWGRSDDDGVPPSPDASGDEPERRGTIRYVGGSAAADEGSGEERQRLRNAALDSRYGPALRRWERIIGRPAPSPTTHDGRDGAERLSPAFVEWMMGLPAGHVTDVAIDRRSQLKALGNGVVPQQAALALSVLLSHSSS